MNTIRGSIRIRRTLTGVAVAIAAMPLAGVAVTAIAVPSALAAGCTTGVSVNISDTVYAGGASGPATADDFARAGDAIGYSITVNNGTAGSQTECPVSGGKVTLTLPGGATQTLATDLSLASGTSASYTEQTPLYIVKDANLTAGIADASVKVTGTADEGNDLTEAVSASATYETPVIHPETTLTKSASATKGTAPMTVTYTFVEKNVSPDTWDGSASLDALTDVTVTDNNPACTPTRTVGTGTSLAVGDSWTYTCTVVMAKAETVTDQATGNGLAGDGRSEGTPASDGAPKAELSNIVTVVAAAKSAVAAATTTTTLPPETTTTLKATTSALAFTGSDTGPMLGIAGGFLALGLALLGLSRRRIASKSHI